MCTTWGRIRMRIGIVLMPIRIRIRISINMEIRNSDPNLDRLPNDANPQHCPEDREILVCLQLSYTINQEIFEQWDIGKRTYLKYFLEYPCTPIQRSPLPRSYLEREESIIWRSTYQPWEFWERTPNQEAQFRLALQFKPFGLYWIQEPESRSGSTDLTESRFTTPI